MRTLSALCLLTLTFACLSGRLSAQCAPLSSATAGITLTFVQTNVYNCSGVAYNPSAGLYYGVRAGNPSLPLETWDASGTPKHQTSAGFDYRGMWWNPTTSQLEANGYNTLGIWKANLDSNGYALKTGTTIFNSNQPHWQSCGDLDTDAYEIIYYYDGKIYRYNRSDNSLIGSYSLNGCPVSWLSVNTTTVVYTGCSGNEIGILDHVNKRLLYFDKSTGNYTSFSQLPASAPVNNAYRMSWANGLLWLFDPGTFTWYSYSTLSGVLGAEIVSFYGKDDLEQATRKLNWIVVDEGKWKNFNVWSSANGTDFEFNGSTTNLEMEMHGHFGMPMYYQLRGVDTNGKEVQTEVIFIDGELAEPTMKVYPNPTVEYITLELAGISGETAKVTLTDMSGKIVYENEHPTTGHMKINVSELPAGSYYCKIVAGQSILGKMVVVGG